MDWYMDRKIPHVLGHEVAGIIEESGDSRFPVGSRVFVHHHAPCLNCPMCRQELYVHCEQWKRTKLVPGGMAEYFAVSPENLNDAFLVDDLRPQDAALIEPLACVVKSFDIAGHVPDDERQVAVIGLGVMGLMHALLAPGCVGFEINADRAEQASELGISVNQEIKGADVIFVCPGSQSALDKAVELVCPGSVIVLFAPMPPNSRTMVDLSKLYFADASLRSSYSCGPADTKKAAAYLREGKINAEQVVSNFIKIDELPGAYRKMKAGEILKPMVMF